MPRPRDSSGRQGPPPSRPWPVRLAGLGLASAVVLCAPPASADYRQSYLDGRRALERGDVEQALALLGAAARERPVEQARARLVGAIPEPYLPHHYLGLAWFRAGRCPEAVAEWELSERQGAVQTVAAAHALARRHRADCASLEAAERALDDAGDAAAALAAAGGERGPGPPGFDRRRSAALAEIEAARELLERGRREWDFAPVAEAAERAEAAASELEALHADRSRSSPSGPGVESTAAATEAAPDARDEPDVPAESGSAAGAAGVPIEPGAARAEEGAPAAAASAPPPAPGSASPSLEAAGAPLPDDLLAAIQSYFDGDYRGALALLAPAGSAADDASGRRARFLAALFRAASRHALFLLGGERERELLRAAEADVAECRRAVPGFAPQPDHFSPRFVAFFAGVSFPGVAAPASPRE